MERIDGEKIIESLHVIQKVCNDNLETNVCGNCTSTKCPFEVCGACAVTYLRPDNLITGRFLNIRNFRH